MSTKQVTGFIAVSDKQAAEAGSSTWFQLSGGVKAADLMEAGKQLGIDEADLPAEITPKAAIRRAVDSFKSKHVAVNCVSQGVWAIARTTGNTKAGESSGRVILSVRLGGFGESSLIFDHDGSADAIAMENSIQAAYAQNLTELSAADLSAWLVDTAGRCQGIPLRERGGVYFIPRHGLDGWRKAASALKTVAPGCDVYELPTMKSAEAVRSIIAAMTREAEAFAADIFEKMNENTLGKRALLARQGDCDTLLGKLNEYEALLGANLDTVKDRINQLSAAVAVAAIAADSDVPATHSNAA